jgi:hypothetical protein
MDPILFAAIFPDGGQVPCCTGFAGNPGHAWGSWLKSRFHCF